MPTRPPVVGDVILVATAGLDWAEWQQAAFGTVARVLSDRDRIILDGWFGRGRFVYYSENVYFARWTFAGPVGLPFV